MCLQFHLINSIESTVPKTRKRVFHIPDEYQIASENSAESCNICLIFWIVEDSHSVHCDSNFAAKPDFGENLSKKLSKVDISAIF